MVLINQRMYYENPSQSYVRSADLGMLEARTGLRSEISNSRTIEGVTITQVSSIQVSEASTEVDLKPKIKINDDIELGEAEKGFKWH